MKKDDRPFWDLNLNPITMMPVSINNKPILNSFEASWRNKSESIKEDCVTSTEASEILGIGGKRIKHYAGVLGEYSRSSNQGSLYKKDTIEEIRKLMLLEKKPEEKIDKTEGYISNPELMRMFNIVPYKAWEIAKKYRLVKKLFNKNVAYYERKRAIEVFSKYSKL
jgi:hypothetical protein